MRLRLPLHRHHRELAELRALLADWYNEMLAYAEESLGDSARRIYTAMLTSAVTVLRKMRGTESTLELVGLTCQSKVCRTLQS